MGNLNSNSSADLPAISPPLYRQRSILSAERQMQRILASKKRRGNPGWFDNLLLVLRCADAIMKVCVFVCVCVCVCVVCFEL